MSERPAARMKSKAPNEMPFSACCTKTSGVRASLARVGHARDLVDDRVDGVAALHGHLTDVHVLYRVMRVLVELERAARAVELDALERRDEGVLVRGVALGRLEREVERGHAVPCLQREDVGQEVVLLLISVDEGFV